MGTDTRSTVLTSVHGQTARRQKAAAGLDESEVEVQLLGGGAAPVSMDVNYVDAGKARYRTKAYVADVANMLQIGDCNAQLGASSHAAFHGQASEVNGRRQADVYY